MTGRIRIRILSQHPLKGCVFEFLVNTLQKVARRILLYGHLLILNHVLLNDETLGRHTVILSTCKILLVEDLHFLRKITPDRSFNDFRYDGTDNIPILDTLFRNNSKVFLKREKISNTGKILRRQIPLRTHVSLFSRILSQDFFDHLTRGER
jgi:hypothetical protein